MKIEKPVIQFISKHKRASSIVALLGIMTQIFTIAIPVSIGKYYELAFDFNARRAQFLGFIPDELWNTIPKFLIFFMIIIALRYLFYFSYEFYLRKGGELFIKDIKDQLFQHQMHVNYEIYLEKGIGKYLLRYSGDIASLKNLYLKGGISVLIDIFVLLLAIIWFAALSLLGALVLIIGSLLAYWVIYLINIKMKYHSLSKRNRTSGQLSFVSRALQGILTVILMNKQDIEAKKYRKKSKLIKEEAVLYNKWKVINTGFISFTQYMILALMLWAFYLSNKESMSGAHLISFILLYITILPTIRRVFGLATVYKMGNISLSKLNNILELEQEEKLVGETLKVVKPSVVFEEFSIGQTANKLSFNAHKSSVTIVDIPKTISFLDLAQAIMQIDNSYSGTIAINKQDIRKFSAQSVRDCIAIVTSQSSLIGRTVYEATTVARSKKTLASTGKLLDHVQRKFDLEPLTLKTKIGENGSNLSVVYYEMLCLIRGLNSERKILFVDEFKMLNTTLVLELLKETGKTVIFIKS